MLEVKIARKTYALNKGGSRDIFRDFSLSLPLGQVGAILGPSGIGKTTLLRMICGLDRDFSGAITLPHGGVTAKIGMVFQEPRLLPWLSVSQNIKLVAPDLAAARLWDLLDMFGLAAHEHHLPRELSLGLARRVSLARALAIAPDVLILDEPFASLDDALRLRLRGEIAASVATLRLTTLLVTHEVDDAIALADRIFVLGGAPTQLLKSLEVPTPRAMDAQAAAELRGLI